MTDREKATIILHDLVQDIYGIYEESINICYKNQNRPPEGEADGSFTEDQWVSLRDIVSALQTIKINYGKLR